VNWASQRWRLAFIYRLGDGGLDPQHFLFNEAPGDGHPSSRQDARVGLPRNSHLLGGCVLIEALDVGESDRFKRVQRDRDRVGLARGPPDRAKSSGCQPAANAAWNQGRWHNESICSYQDGVNDMVGPIDRRHVPPGTVAIQGVDAHGQLAQRGPCAFSTARSPDGLLALIHRFCLAAPPLSRKRSSG
jgi:hypothetical protein